LLWLEGLLTVMNPYPGKHGVLVLDNCRIHHVEGVEEMCEAAQVSISDSICEAELTLFPAASNLSSFHRTPPISIRSRDASHGSKPTSSAMAKHSGTLLSSGMRLLLFCFCIELSIRSLRRRPKAGSIIPDTNQFFVIAPI
jgi:hypothetical protein